VNLDRLQEALRQALTRACRRETPPPDADRGAVDAVRGERLAARYLQGRGHRILARNLRVGHDEADLLTMPDPTLLQLAVVEVKTSRRDAAEALLRIDAGKQRRLVRLANGLLSRPEFARFSIRFDCVGVDLRGDPPVVEHRPAAFEAAWPRAGR
jgi:putative endonuclease